MAATSLCSGSKVSTAAKGIEPFKPPLELARGLIIQTIARVDAPREIVALPNGDLLVGTRSSHVFIVPNAESARASGAPRIFATITNETIPREEPAGGYNAEGVAFSPLTCTIYVATEYHIWSTPYRDGDLIAEDLRPIATVRTGPIADPGDGDNHTSTSVAVSGTTLYASMGSSCDGCTGERDPQRAAIWRMNLDGADMRLFARRIRNAIALAVNPESGHLWAAGAGQDDLPEWHPYEYADDVTASAAEAGGVADYGWPYCEENHLLYNRRAGSPKNCDGTVEPRVEFAAYTTHVGAAFYPLKKSGPYAMPAYAGALFVTNHGSWHTPNGCTLPPDVLAVPMRGDVPKTAMTDWGVPKPESQLLRVVTGFQKGCGAATRVGRATGIAVGAKGSIFVADDLAGSIYRVRP